MYFPPFVFIKKIQPFNKTLFSEVFCCSTKHLRKLWGKKWGYKHFLSIANLIWVWGKIQEGCKTISKAKQQDVASNIIYM